MIPQRERARFAMRQPREEIINVHIRLLSEFRPYVKSLLPMDCKMCKGCQAKKAEEKAKALKERHVALNQRPVRRKTMDNFGSVVLNKDDGSKRVKSAGSRAFPTRKDYVMNPRLVSQRGKNLTHRPLLPLNLDHLDKLPPVG